MDQFRSRPRPNFAKPSTSPMAKKFFHNSASSSRRNKSSNNILQKLFVREVRGQFQADNCPRSSKVRPFTRLPGRLAFCLKDVIPFSAFEAGHIFLGFSKCGQFLISYTQTAADNIDLVGDFLQIPYQYRLHWWLFIPYKRAKKVAEVMLFSNAGADGNLHLSICQWPRDHTKVLVYGYQKPKVEEMTSATTTTASSAYSESASMTSSVPCYVTVTAVPSLKACQDCVNVAASYEEDELAAAWNSCARLSCLEHGVTVHTSFDLVPPYPKFEPKISMKLDSAVVINSGNLLHFLRFDLDKRSSAKRSAGPDGSAPSTTSLAQQSEALLQKWQQQQCLFSPSSRASDSDLTDCESELSVSSHGLARWKKGRPGLNSDRREKVAEFADQLSQFDSLVAWHGIERIEADDSKRKRAEKAYELTDDDLASESVKEKLSTFRKKRLADKKYEFREEEEDDDYGDPKPLARFRGRGGQAAAASSDAAAAASSSDLSDLLIDTLPAAAAAVPELLSPGGMVKKDPAGLVNSPNSDPPVRFHAKFTRRFVELDEESVSVMTEVEDDDLGSTQTGYHMVLPLEVHGAAYQPMAMISNAKAERSGSDSASLRCLKVTQRSLDVELVCHDMAQRLCSTVDKKYWFCSDYDVEVVDVDPTSGEVVCVAVVLVMATVVTKKVSAGERSSVLQRHLYQGGFTFSWYVDDDSAGRDQQFCVVDSDPLKEIAKEPHGGVWHPAKAICSDLQRTWVNSSADVRCFTNDSVMQGTSLKTMVDTDHFVAIILDDLE